jgi:hypothetical protein
MARVPGMRERTRFRVGADVLAETDAGMVMRLDQRPPGEDGADVTVMLAPTVSPSSAASELRLLAVELEERALGLGR